MTFKFILTTALSNQLDKLTRKDKVLALAVRKKITQIINSDRVFLEHFKNLRGNLKDYKRVHVKSFVLFFKLEGDTIIFDKLRHYDEAY
ncbi:MAG: hypothetical protein KJ718_01170 [Nanoarchaeota archaeon]|nr:hypothetical protein [Nanoarchaeota archaeon]